MLTYAELEACILEAAAKQPRGWQSELARRLRVKPPTIIQVIKGRRRVPPQHLHIYLDAVGLELRLVPRGNPPSESTAGKDEAL